MYTSVCCRDVGLPVLSFILLLDARSKKHYRTMDDSNCSEPVVTNDIKPLLSRKRQLTEVDENFFTTDKRIPLQLESNEFFDYSSLKETIENGGDKPKRLSENQEADIIEHLDEHFRYYGIRCSPVKARLYRKLKLKQRKRKLGLELFDMVEYVKACIEPVDHYKTDADFDNPVPVLATTGETDECTVGVVTCYTGGVEKSIGESESSNDIQYDTRMVKRAESILSKLSLPLMPVLIVKGVHNSTCSTLVPSASIRPFTSPYTSRILKPIIFQSYDFTPVKLEVLTELINKVNQSNVVPSCPLANYNPHPVTFCYFGEHHLSSVNALISYFFWPVNLKEYLQYPDFTVVVQYGKLVIGCGFMTPDVKVSEAYIPFLLIHPDFCGCGLGKVMLYHLIQSCQGKDVTLHVSVDNPAMLMYQQFGFKAEQFCIDFYDKYYPPSYCLSKHAFLMRLRR